MLWNCPPHFSRPTKETSPYSYLPNIILIPFPFLPAWLAKTVLHFTLSGNIKTFLPKCYISHFPVTSRPFFLLNSASEIPLWGTHLKEIVTNDGQEVRCFTIGNLKDVTWRYLQWLVNYNIFVGWNSLVIKNRIVNQSFVTWAYWILLKCLMASLPSPCLHFLVWPEIFYKLVCIGLIGHFNL